MKILYTEKKSNRKIIHILGLRLSYCIVWTKCVLKKAVADNQNNPLDIFVVSFNNAKLIKYQILLFKKFLCGNYVLTIVDNSTQKTEAEKIAQICEQYKISYYKLKQHGKISPSRSHGASLDWIYNNIIAERKNNFCFLDHDVFPLKKIDINAYIPQKFGGVVIQGKTGWFIWPGFAFFNYDYLKDKEVGFAPSAAFHLDTGGSMYETIYQYENENEVQKSKSVRLAFNVNKFSDSGQSTDVDIIDDVWIHTICGSEWVPTYGKQEKVYELLDALLKSPAENTENIIKQIAAGE